MRQLRACRLPKPAAETPAVGWTSRRSGPFVESCAAPATHALWALLNWRATWRMAWEGGVGSGAVARSVVGGRRIVFRVFRRVRCNQRSDHETHLLERAARHSWLGESRLSLLESIVVGWGCHASYDASVHSLLFARSIGLLASTSAAHGDILLLWGSLTSCAAEGINGGESQYSI